MRIGATAVPINPIYTPDEISYIVKNSDAKAIIALDALLPLVEKAAVYLRQWKIILFVKHNQIRQRS